MGFNITWPFRIGDEGFCVVCGVSGFAQAEHGFGALRVNQSQRKSMVKASIRNNVLRIQLNLDHSLDVVKIKKVHGELGVVFLQHQL